MNALPLYMVKSAVFLAGFYLIYYLFLGRDTQYARNRFYLTGSLILAMILPLFSFRVPSGSLFYNAGAALSEIIVRAGINNQDEDAKPALLNGWALKIYFAGALLFFLKFLADISVIVFLIVRRGNPGSRIITFEKFNSPGFSAMGYIFINRNLGPEQAADIIRHEYNHVARQHFLDILLLETVKCLQWFNPVIYLFNRSLRAVHEYQADSEYLKTGQSLAGYQALLMNTLLNTRIFVTSNSFSNPSLIRKRLLMMSKKKTPGISAIKVVLAVPVAAALILIISACEKISGKRAFAPPEINAEITEPDAKAPKEIFVVVEDMPEFPGGDKALMEFIYSNIQYPPSAIERGIEGRVILRFCINYEGLIENVDILRGVDPDLDNEAVRVIKMLPRWTPGKQGGKPVNVWYSVPVTFQLR